MFEVPVSTAQRRTGGTARTARTHLSSAGTGAHAQKCTTTGAGRRACATSQCSAISPFPTVVRMRRRTAEALVPTRSASSVAGRRASGASASSSARVSSEGPPTAAVPDR